MYYKILAVMLLCVMAFNAFAQKVEGTIKSGKGEGIGYTSISVLNHSKGTFSNTDGSYSLEMAPGTYQIRVSAVGFASRVQKVTVADGIVRLDFELTERTQSLDEVVITAQKREEKLAEAPLAVTTLSAQKVENTRTWELEDLNSLVPNYYYGEIGVGFQQIQSIRGIQVFSENPAVATYIDGVNQLDILSNGFQLVDIDRIEVLRGPQGTLFGRNAMGGVINIITKQPTNKQTGFAEFNIGNLGLQRYALGVKAPIIDDKLFFGFSGLYQFREGFLKNDTTGTVTPDPDAHGKTVGNETSVYGNVYLKWLVSDQFDATLNVKGQIDNSDASSFFIYQETDALAQSNPDQVNLGQLGTHRRDVLNTALSMNYHAPAFTLSSTTAYQVLGLSFKDIYDVNRLVSGFGGTTYASYKDGDLGIRSNPQKVFTQELKVSSTSADSRLQYTGGVFYFNQTAFEPTTNIGIDYGAVNGPLFLGPLYTPDTHIVLKNNGENYGYAAFGQISYDLMDQLTVTAGLRYDFEARKNTFNGFGDLINQGGQDIEFAPDTTVEADFNALSPKLAVAYKLNDKANVYASYTRGFRAGGINTQRIQGQDLTYDPEFSNNIEIGYKSNYLQNKLFLAATAYYIDWDDIQFFSQVAPNVFLFDNVGKVASYGLEIEVSAIPLKHLHLDVSYGVNESEYKNFELSSGETIIQLNGNRLANTPSSTLFTGAQYDLAINDALSAIVRLEWRRTGDLFSDRENDLKIEAYDLINMRIGLSYRRKLNLAFWARNLNNKRYIAYASPSTINGNRNSLIAAPRTYGLTLSTKF